MPLIEKQRQILTAMLIGAAVTALMIALGLFVNPFDYPEALSGHDKFKTAALWSLVPITCLAISIARLAKHRFLNHEDMDANHIAGATDQARVLQSLLQNTLEQTMLACLIYFAWSALMPATYLSVVPIAALMFGLGRLLFFIRYNKGAPARAIGFTLTFYPSITMLMILVLHQV